MMDHGIFDESNRSYGHSHGVPMNKGEWCSGEDLEIEPERPIPEVGSVMPQPFRDRGIGLRWSPMAANLRQTRHPRPHKMAVRIVRKQIGEEIVHTHCMRSRSDQRHVPLYNIQELRQFIEATVTEQLAKPRQPFVSHSRLNERTGGFSNPHGAELVDEELLLSPPVALLPEQCRAGTIENDCQRNQEQGWRQTNDQNRSQHDIKDALQTRVVDWCRSALDL